MFLYSLKSALLLTLLYLPYLLLMHRETYFRFNRLVLVAIMLFSLALPLVNVAPLSLDSVPAVGSVQTRLIDMGVPIENHALPDKAVPKPSTMTIWQLLTSLYALVAIVLLVSRLWGFVRLKRIVHHGSIDHLQHDGLHIYIHAGEVAPFSWGRSIVISQKDYEAHGREILLHETGHIRLHHSADVVLLTLCQMLQWFNPFVWMMGRSLTDLHEYEADRYALCGGVDARDYQRLLLQRAVGSSAFGFVQSFSGAGLTRKRIKMMHAVPKPAMHLLRIVYVLPVLLLTLSIFATSEFNEFRAAVVEKDPTVPVIAQVLNSLLPSPAPQTEEKVTASTEVPSAEEVSVSPAQGDSEADDPLDATASHQVSSTVVPARPEPLHVHSDEPIEVATSVASSAVLPAETVSIAPPEVHRFSVPSITARPVAVTVNPENERMIDLGYGKLKKKYVSSNVNGYTGEELMKTGYRSLPEALAHRVAGLRYAGGRLIYRDSYVTLFIVDDVRCNSFDFINLGDIDYVEFDSEAFIYGTQGHYAIRVHTKR